MGANDLDNKEILFKEIDLIEECIKRMASNSFLLKGWAVTILSVLIGLTVNTDNWKFGSVIAILICIVFWYLDATYLKLERLYTRKYNWIIKNRLTTKNYAFNLNPNEKNMWLTTENSDIKIIKDVMLSPTLCPLYVAMLIASSVGFWLPFILWLIFWLQCKLC